MSLEGIVSVFSDGVADRHAIFGKIVQYIDNNLDDTLRRIDSVYRSHRRWKRARVEQQYVLVDLGNIHNVLQDVDGVLDWPIYAFADKCFNGYGVNPPCSDKIVVYRAAESTKNAADIHIIWVVSQICFENKEKCTIHVVTKDKGFLELADLAKRYNHA
jgi:hypothetical protein